MAIEDLKTRIKDTPINHIIGAYIPVEKKGAGFVAQCPFHDDSNPSLQINPTRGMFKCFVDDIGGDAITFVMEFKKLEFMDALRDICQVMGWNFDDYDDKRPKSPREEMAKKILQKVTLLYERSAQSSKVFEEFKQNRGISDDIAKAYHLGFAPGNNAVTRYLNSIPEQKERDFALKIAQEIGLIKEDKYRGPGSHYDTFRERIVFPIWDHFGHVNGYTTRATMDSQKAKYMNSVDSFVFHKTNILYGFHLAKPFIKERNLVLLCEGNMDQLALYKNGFEHNVAVMGVALGESSLQRLIHLTKNVVLALDTDQGGRKAAERMNQQLLEEGIVARFIEFTPHKDPDDFLKAEGRLALAKRLEEAKSFIDIRLDELIPGTLPETPEAKMAILERAFEMLAPLGESISATERIAALSKRLGIRTEISVLLKSYTKYLEDAKKQKLKRPTPIEKSLETTDVPENRQFLSSKSDKSQEITPSTKKIGPVERRLIKEILRHPEYLIHDKIAGLLDFMGSDEVKKYVLRLKNLVYEVDDSEFPKFALRELDAPEYSLEIRELVGSAVYELGPAATLNENVIDRMLDDLKRKLEEDQLKNKRDELKKLQEECTTLEEQHTFSGQIANLNKQINNLRRT